MGQTEGPGFLQRPIRSFVRRSGRLTRGQQVALQNYWPLYGVDFTANRPLNFATLFPGLSCIKLEIGFGNGESLVQMAAQDQTCGYIGIEVHDPGAGSCLQRIHDLKLENLRLISHDAIEVLESMVPENSLHRIFLFFPDPWHKKRHHKRRIVNRRFRDLLIAAMKTGAVLHMATDWREYAEHMARNLFSDQRFKNLGDEQGYSRKPDYRPITKFERRGQRLGHGVWDLLFMKK